MGIRYLYTFVNQVVPHGTFKVNIVNEINDWKRKNPGEQPIIVIDMPGLIHGPIKTDMEDLHGGRSQITITRVEKMLQTFCSHGVKLVFFDDGPSQPKKYDTIIRRQGDQLNRIHDILHKVSNGQKSHDIIRTTRDMPSTSHHNSNIRLIASKYGTVIKTFHNECDTEIAAYANEHKALAIMADDTDFLIFPGKWKYWSFKNFAFDDFSTMEFSRRALRHELQLTEEQMPMFSTICGNDVVDFDEVVEFHRRLGNPRQHFYNVAAFVRRIYQRPQLTYDDYLGIARQVMPKRDTNETIELIEKSCKVYNLNEMEASRLKDGGQLEMVANILSGSAYEILQDLPMSVSHSLFDIRLPDYSKYYPVILNVVRRIMGIVLQHKNDERIRRRIFTHRSMEAGYCLEELRLVFPPIAVPPLVDLYDANKNDDQALHDTKLALLGWMVCDNLSTATLKLIDSEYFQEVVTLNFMVENTLVSVAEADLFLHTIRTVHTVSESLDKLKPTVQFNQRAFQVVFIFFKFMQIIRRGISAVGLSHFNNLLLFDGYFFHSEYDGFMRLSSEARAGVLKDLSHLRIYAT